MVVTYKSKEVSALVYSLPLHNLQFGQASRQSNAQNFVWGSSRELGPLPRCLEGSMLPVGKVSSITKAVTSQG